MIIYDKRQKTVPMQKKIGTLLFTTKSGIPVYDCGDYFRFTLPPTDGTTGPEWIKRLEDDDFRLTYGTDTILLQKSFKPTNGISTEVVVLKGAMFEDGQRVIKNIRKTAKGYKLENPSTETACLIREKFTDKALQVMGLSRVFIMHNPVKNHKDEPCLLTVDCGEEGRRVTDRQSSTRLRYGYGFAFVLPQVDTNV